MATATTLPVVATESSRPGKSVWVFQLIAAGILAMTLPFKFGAAPESVQLFDDLGAGAAGRLGTAVLETIAVAMLLTPRLAALGALMTLGLLAGAIFSHLTILGVVYPEDASLFTFAVVGFTAAAIATWMRRRELPIIGKSF